MSETPLQKLLRLKKEKEGQNGQPSSALEKVQEPTGQDSSGSGMGTGKKPEFSPELQGTQTQEPEVGNLGGQTIESVSIPDSDDPSGQVVSKPLSAMDRLRALKSGYSSNNANAVPSDNTTGLHNSPIVQAESITPSKPIKPRKTHPIAMEMAELEAALDSHVPGFVNILSTIHKKLRQDPDVVTLLDDEEIAVIVAGLEKHTNVTIVAPSAVKAAKSKARKEPVSAGDL